MLRKNWSARELSIVRYHSIFGLFLSLELPAVFHLFRQLIAQRAR